MIDYDAAIARYFEAWNADADSRAEAVAAAWTEDGTYTDPMSNASGHEDIAAVITGAAEQFPGFTFKLAGAVDGNHHIARFTWELVAPDGTAPVAGSDAVILDEDGRVRNVLGFLDRVPSA